MSVITEQIGPQAFELIRDQLGAIIFDELDAQHIMSYNKIFLANVYMERFVPFNESELIKGAINVTVARQELSNQSPLQSDGMNSFFIDVYQCAKTQTEDGKLIDGGSIATKNMHRLCGVVRGILEHTKYLTLGLPGIVTHRKITEIRFNNQKIEDKVSVSTARMVFQVRADERNGKASTRVLEGLTIRATINESDAGYSYFGEPITIDGLDYVLDYILP